MFTRLDMPNANLENFVLCDVTVYGFIIIARKKKKKIYNDTRIAGQYNFITFLKA